MSTSTFPDVMLRLFKVPWGDDGSSGKLNLQLHPVHPVPPHQFMQRVTG